MSRLGPIRRWTSFAVYHATRGRWYVAWGGKRFLVPIPTRRHLTGRR